MAEIASAYVSLIPSFKGGQAAIAKQLDGPLSAAGKSGGSKMSAALGGALKKGALGAGLAAGGVLTKALFSGFNRLKAIDEAKAKLSGLGHSAKSVDTIMKNALTSVKGTAFGLGDAATIAASAVAAGIKPGKDLTRTLSLVADSATIAGTDLGSMGQIFGKVAASNKIQGDVIAQLNDAGIPIIQLLSKELGKSAEETVALASAGKINFATFQDAMETGLGGAAKKSGKTVSGAFANMNAALGRLGATILGPIFKRLPAIFGAVTTALDGVGPYLERFTAMLGPIVAKIGQFFSGITLGSGQAGAVMTQLLATVQSVWSGIQIAFTTAISVVTALWNTFGSTLTTYLQATAQNLLQIIQGGLQVIQGVFNVFAGLFTGDWSRMWDGIKQIFSGVWKIIQALIDQGWEYIKTAFKLAGTAVKAIFSGIWDGIKSLAKKGIDALVSAVKAVPGKLKALGGVFKDAGVALIKALINGLSRSGGAAADFAAKIWNAVKSIINSGIGRLNSLLEFTIPIKGLPDVHVNPPNIPYLAKGGIVTRPTLAVIGEAGPEAVVPLSGRGRRGIGAAAASSESIDPATLAPAVRQALEGMGLRLTGTGVMADEFAAILTANAARSL